MKTAKSDPLFPVRSDHKILKKILDSSYKVVHLPEEYALMISVFERAGGSWKGVFEGDIRHLRLLKKVVRVAYKNHHLTRQPSWD